ncbi:MAG: hypothetical protein LBH43_21195 [Treponema sp.]|jgi:hypothetical protein|nr:hypothetical protein [Treponema sp.]
MNVQAREIAISGQIHKCHHCGKTIKGRQKGAVFTKTLAFCSEGCYDMAYYYAIGKNFHK